MDFITFKNDFIAEYDAINRDAVIRVEVPNDIEMLKLFVAIRVFDNYNNQISAQTDFAEIRDVD